MLRLFGSRILRASGFWRLQYLCTLIIFVALISFHVNLLPSEAQEVIGPNSDINRIIANAPPEHRQAIRESWEYGNALRPFFDQKDRDEKIWEEEVPGKIIGHFKGKQGKILVTESPDIMSLLPKELIPEVPSIADFKDKVRDGRLFEDIEIQNCTSSKTEFKKSKSEIESSMEPQVYLDSLYLDKMFFTDNSITKDAKELFGPEITVSKYDRGGNSAVNALIKARGIPCLPYRIRITSNGISKFTGRDALKLFEGPKSKGTLHPIMKEVVRRLR